MYSPPLFEQPRVELMLALLAAHPLATLVTSSTEGLDANHIPLLWKPDGTANGKLVGHVARANPLWKQANPTVDVLAIFHGPEGYISPNWYATKHEAGKVVPTWNYAVVHAYGSLRAIQDRDWLLAQLEELVASHEQAMPMPWKISDAPAEFINRLTEAIVGIEISISRLVGKWKVSQNQPEANQRSVVEGLKCVGSDRTRSMAALVEARGEEGAI
jgi:transcriptional regulator